MSRTLTDEDVEAIANAVARRLHNNPPLERIGVKAEELQQILGAPSMWSTHNLIRALGLKTFAKGYYRLRDVENKVARRTRD